MKKIPQPPSTTTADAASDHDASETPSTDKPADKPAKPARQAPRVSRSQARRLSRERALQALYQLDLGDDAVHHVRQQFLDTQDMSRADVDYFHMLLNGVTGSCEAIDTDLEPVLDRPIEELDPIERGVLRIACLEMRERLDIPVKVVINEGVEITKRFGADQGHKYVNGVLDKLAMRLRAVEMRNRS